MQSELKFNKKKFAGMVLKEYGIHITSMELIPEGAVSHNYKAYGEGKKKYFIKIYDNSAEGKKASALSKRYLPLIYKLKYEGNIADINVPYITKSGALKTVFDSMTVMIYDFISGTPIGDLRKLDAKMAADLARDMGRYHTASAGWGEKADYGKIYSDINGLEKRVRKVIEMSRVCGDTTSSGVLKIILDGFEKKCGGYFEKLKKLSPIIGKPGGSVVFCHGDLHGWNILKDADNRLRFFDWEFSFFGPPEGDLWFMTRLPDFKKFYAEYKKYFKGHKLNPEVMEYFALFYSLNVLASCSLRVLSEKNEEAQDRIDIGIVKEQIKKLKETEQNIYGKITV